MTGLQEDGHVHADRQRLRQVLLNLLSNAIKYNRAGGRVDVSFQRTETGTVRTVVADTGIGIESRQLARAFEPFDRLGAEGSDVEGTGLGLTLSKRLVEAMNGSITVESELGHGTTFIVELNSADAPQVEQDAQQPSRDASLKSRIDPGATGQRLLYIEDNVSNLTLVERILERQPAVELIPAMQGSLGLDLAREHHPDLILLDLHLPDMAGEEVLRRLQADPSTRHIPVVVLSADANKRQSERLLHLGASNYLTKPLDIQRFLEVIAANLNAKEE
jgi:CheY-like chemotaxis protein/anti-sigma regulatory factor (Ser/Thr protein kinase)